MKAKVIISTLLFAFLFAFGHEAQAQVNDTLPPWFQKPGLIITKDDILRKGGTFMIEPSVLKAAKPISVSQAKTLKLSRKVKRMPSTIVIKRKGNCYKIGCDDTCEKCQMFWYDKNNDKRVQPKKELRCYCVAKKTRCKMRGKKIPCKK
ncbi:MAG: hypothetical protein MRZ79_16620 [Bacteroidia bacterium]|nr:hypothetical protein [Bacteroidia bacterium]